MKTARRHAGASQKALRRQDARRNGLYSQGLQAWSRASDRRRWRAAKGVVGRGRLDCCRLCLVPQPCKIETAAVHRAAGAVPPGEWVAPTTLLIPSPLPATKRQPELLCALSWALLPLPVKRSPLLYTLCAWQAFLHARFAACGLGG